MQPLCKEYIDELAVNLQEKDRQELWACYRLPVREGLEKCIRASVLTVVFLYEGKVGAIAGLEATSLLGNQACVWSWTSKQVRRCPHLFMRLSKQILASFQQRYPYLYAACDQRHSQAAKYLFCLGARPTGKKFYLAGEETQFLLYQWK